jgi:hypothetical protein
LPVGSAGAALLAAFSAGDCLLLDPELEGDTVAPLVGFFIIDMKPFPMPAVTAPVPRAAMASIPNDDINGLNSAPAAKATARKVNILFLKIRPRNPMLPFDF